MTVLPCPFLCSQQSYHVGDLDRAIKSLAVLNFCSADEQPTSNCFFFFWYFEASLKIQQSKRQILAVRFRLQNVIRSVCVGELLSCVCVCTMSAGTELLCASTVCQLANQDPRFPLLRHLAVCGPYVLPSQRLLLG